MVPGLTWAMGNDNKFENNLIANRKFTQVVTTLIFLTDYGKKKIFIEVCMKGDPFVTWKEITLVKRIILELKSEMWK